MGKLEGEPRCHDAIRNREEEYAEHLEPGEAARRQSGGEDVDADMDIADVGVAKPEHEQHAVEMPFQLLDRRRSEPGDLKADLAGDDVPANDPDQGEVDPSRSLGDAVEYAIDGVAQRQQLCHATSSLPPLARRRAVVSFTFGNADAAGAPFSRRP